MEEKRERLGRVKEMSKEEETWNRKYLLQDADNIAASHQVVKPMVSQKKLGLAHH